MLWLCPIHVHPPGPMSSLTSCEKNSVKFQTASISQPTGQLTEVTAVKIQSDSQGLSATFHLVTHRRVCNKKSLIMTFWQCKQSASENNQNQLDIL